LGVSKRPATSRGKNLHASDSYWSSAKFAGARWRSGLAGKTLQIAGVR
jgi:hypothetical protein